MVLPFALGSRLSYSSSTRISGIHRGTIDTPLHVVAKDPSSIATTCEQIVAAFPELPVRIELAATGGVRNAIESGEMQADSWTLFGLELQKCVQARGGGCLVCTRILEGEEEAQYEYAAAKFAVQLALAEHLDSDDIAMFSMGGASMQFHRNNDYLSVPLGINAGRMLVEEKGEVEGGRIWEEEARAGLQKALGGEWSSTSDLVVLTAILQRVLAKKSTVSVSA